MGILRTAGLAGLVISTVVPLVACSTVDLQSTPETADRVGPRGTVLVVIQSADLGAEADQAASAIRRAGFEVLFACPRTTTTLPASAKKQAVSTVEHPIALETIDDANLESYAGVWIPAEAEGDAMKRIRSRAEGKRWRVLK